ncbi:hypothetical protein [Flavobacterium saccharophilum]|uniref:hypothetical protein n=1 Tax=Flavobacterium saccharophilum TaxID=29534 RepID=UPI00135628C2|nr:hypothetical protein [Flavobacterium saccharophilum]
MAVIYAYLNDMISIYDGLKAEFGDKREFSYAQVVCVAVLMLQEKNLFLKRLQSLKRMI